VYRGPESDVSIRPSAPLAEISVAPPETKFGATAVEEQVTISKVAKACDMMCAAFLENDFDLLIKNPLLSDFLSKKP
jgi:hypothetical protein